MVGLGSAWIYKADFDLDNLGGLGKPTVVLAHNTDVENYIAEMFFCRSGAHMGGQVDLP